VGQLIIIEKWAENLEEVTVNRWLKEEGEPVAEGDSLCEIITEKVTFEYEVEQPGVLREIYCPAGSVVPVGYVIAFISQPGEPLPAAVPQNNAELMERYRAAAELGLDLEIALDQLPGPAAQHVRAAPAARRLAREQQVNLVEVAEWMGESRAVTEEDVRNYLQQRATDRADEQLDD